MPTPTLDLIDSYHQVVARQVADLTRQEATEQLTRIVNGERPTTYAGELMKRLHVLVTLPIPAGYSVLRCRCGPTTMECAAN